MKRSPLSLRNLQNPPLTTIAEGLKNAQRVISSRTGIISKLEYVGLEPGEPSVFYAKGTPVDYSFITGYQALNFGAGVSADPDRAAIKAVGECIERYCSSHYDEEDLVCATQNELGKESLVLQDLALFSPSQYGKTDFLFPHLTPDSSLYWAKGYSLSEDKSIWIPASLVYLPYLYAPNEPIFHRQITTGLACGPNLPSAIYRGILEIIERDAFMIIWHNRLLCPTLDLTGIADPVVQSLLKQIQMMPVDCYIKVMTLDIEATAILILFEKKNGIPPYTSLGMAVDLDPSQAIRRALEEAMLVYLGMSRHCRENPDHSRDPEYKKVNLPTDHGIIHAMEPELLDTVQFLKSSDKTLTMKDLPDHSHDNLVDNCKLLVELLGMKGLQTHVVDLTTVDIDDVGFKVARVVIPGMQPLDLEHNCPHLGGKRLYEVPHKLGLIKESLKEDEMNPDPHPCP